jgi:hypothetical protein
VEELLTKPADETVWYENEQAIKEFLGSFRKPAILDLDQPAEELSWLKLLEKSIQI